MSKERLYIFDTTLRDGAQTQGVDFSLEDKEKIALALDDLGVDYIEAGWPGANPTDTEFFQKKYNFKNSKLTSFGMTKRSGRSVENDTGIFEPSTSGRGYWSFTGKKAGQYDLVLIQDNAEIMIDLTINPGEVIQLFGSSDKTEYKQGDKGLLKIYGIDSNGNTVEIEPENTTISCTSGSSSFVTGDTWEIDISKSGLDRSCTISWNGLFAQHFFDVESVLFGGTVLGKGIGSRTSFNDYTRLKSTNKIDLKYKVKESLAKITKVDSCLLYTSPSPRDS